MNIFRSVAEATICLHSAVYQYKYSPKSEEYAGFSMLTVSELKPDINI